MELFQILYPLLISPTGEGVAERSGFKIYMLAGGKLSFSNDVGKADRGGMRPVKCFRKPETV